MVGNLVIYQDGSNHQKGSQKRSQKRNKHQPIEQTRTEVVVDQAMAIEKQGAIDNSEQFSKTMRFLMRCLVIGSLLIL